MARAKSKNLRRDSGASRGFLGYQLMVLRVIVVGAVVGLIAFFHEELGNAIFGTIGFGLILGLIWAGLLVFIVLRLGPRSLLRRWNLWLGTLSLAAATWGILSLFHPSGLTIGGTVFSDVSLGGQAGEHLVGSQGAAVPSAVRLTLLIAAGMALVAPSATFGLIRFLGSSARAAVSAAVSGASRLLAGSGRNLSHLYQRYPLHRLLIAPLIALSHWLRRRPEAESETAKEALSPELDVMPPRPPAAATEERIEAPARIEPTPVPAAPERGQLPPIELLDKVAETEFVAADNEQRARLIEEALASYGVEARVMQINPGPSVTQFGIEPGWDRKYRRVVERDQQGKVKLDRDGNPIERQEEVSKTRVKVERITALANNLALALASPSIRIEAPVPGKPLVGIEVPNTTSAVVRLRSVIESPAFQKVRAKSSLTLALGKGTAGEAVAADLSKMPHLLIAGETGSGKTVCINSIIACLLMQNLPQDMRMLLIDPKRVELTNFAGVPHLISPVVVEVDKAIEALRRVNREMDHRYNKFASIGVRNIEGYNRSQLITEPMPYLVVIIDELAHLMMTAAEVVEPSICRLAQLSRATGIHLIIATQRPSVDVVTGLIKANFPTRIAFAVTSIVDSRTILDTAGAEKLLGRGDMLYMPPDAAKPKRLRGCFASDQEIDRVVKFWKQRGEPYPPHAGDAVATAFASLEVDEIRDEDPMLATARRLARESSHISTSLIQRRLHVGYPRAARIMDSLEREGIISRGEPSGPAEVIEADEEGEE